MKTLTHSRFLACFVGCTLASTLLSFAASLETAPPVVVKTSPVPGTQDIDPRLSEITVTFSKPMKDGSWSWSQISDETFPPIVGKPKYLEDQQTCVVDVKLQPQKTYVLWLNSQKFGNFKDTDGKSSVPYLLVFQTK